MTREDILIFLKSKKVFLEQNYGVLSIGLFGSYARGDEREDSDIDIAVEIESKNKFRSFFDLKYYLEEYLQKKVDLGIESTLKPIAKKHISEEILYV